MLTQGTRWHWNRSDIDISDEMIPQISSTLEFHFPWLTTIMRAELKNTGKVFWSDVLSGRRGEWWTGVTGERRGLCRVSLWILVGTAQVDILFTKIINFVVLWQCLLIDYEYFAFAQHMGATISTIAIAARTWLQSCFRILKNVWYNL